MRRGRALGQHGRWDDAVELWSATHGAASLRIAMPKFPWPPLKRSIETLVRRLARRTG